MLEHETVVRLQNEVAGLRAEKAQLEEKCFSQELQIDCSQKNVYKVGEAENINRKLQYLYMKPNYSLYKVINLFFFLFSKAGAQIGSMQAQISSMKAQMRSMAL